RLFALSLDGLRHGYVWQLLTFQLLHGGWWHLFVNSFAIYFFGRAMEDVLGKARFFKLYFASGVVGGIFQMAGAYFFPSHLGGAVVGASAGGAGLIAAFATMFPEQRLTLLLFFVIPISLQAQTLLWIVAGLAVFGMVVPNNHVAHAAHLGGLLAGIAYIRWFIHGQNPWNNFSWFKKRSKPSRRPSDADGPPRHPWRRAKLVSPPFRELAPGEFISQEVDPILDKISAQGIHSLTDRERDILDAARKRMAKR
ncbi:MAG: rhomboid family intramembrane serine protease, partial [Verrucomicrobiota bacterium]